MSRALPAVVAAVVLAATGASGAPQPRGKRAGANAGATAPAKRPGTRGAGPAGEVKYLTSTLAFLNRGSKDGLAVGASVSFTRSGRPVGSCTVDTVSDHAATCLAGALRKGDTFAVGRLSVEQPVGPVSELASDVELNARREAMLAQDRALVDFAGGAGGTDWHHASVALSNTSYRNFAYPSEFQVQRLDAQVYDVELYKGLRASLDVTVLNFSQRPTNFSSDFRGTPVLLVRQVELGFRRDDVPFSAAVGRVWTRSTPGLLVVDGAQASYRFGEKVEAGLYGGLLPNETSLTLSTKTWTGGAFFLARFDTGKGAESTFVQTEGRVGYAVKDQLGGRFEVGLGAHLYQGKAFDGHLGLELGYGGAQQAVGGVDAARLDLGWRPVEKLRVLLGVRYRGGSPSGTVELGLVSPGQRAVHADGSLAYEVTPEVLLAVTGGAATDFGAGLVQGRVGPDLTFPTLFGKAGGAGLSYAEEFGWLRARHASVQLVFTLFSRVRLLTRTTWFQQVSDGLAANDLGETLNLDVTIFRWLWVRGSVSGRTQLDPERTNADPTDRALPSRTSGLVSVQLGGGF